MTLKMLIPNATAGMIIGKGGEHIRAIKEKTGAYVQLSRKNELPERCITVSGIKYFRSIKLMYVSFFVFIFLSFVEFFRKLIFCLFYL